MAGSTHNAKIVAEVVELHSTRYRDPRSLTDAEVRAEILTRARAAIAAGVIQASDLALAAVLP